MLRLPDGAWRVREEQRLRLTVESPRLVVATLAGERLDVVDEQQTPTGFRRTFAVEIGTWAGRSQLRLCCDGIRVQTLFLDVSPREDKLGVDAYREMLQRLIAISKDLPWGLSGGALKAERDRGSPGVVLPAVLEVELPRLRTCLDRICAAPLTWTERPRALLPFPKSRAVDPTVFRWLVTHPRALRAVRGSDEAPGEDLRSVQVEQRQNLTTLDHPATRALKFALHRLLRLLESTARALSTRREPRAEELATEVKGSMAWLSELLGGRLFGPLRAEPPSETALLSLLDHPLYAQAHRLLHRLLDPGLRLSEAAAVEVSVRPSFDLFELLAFFDLALRLEKALGPSWCWTAPEVAAGEGALLAWPANGATFEARGPRGLTLRLQYQRTFHSWTERSSLESSVRSCTSLTAERRPDFILCVIREGTPERWLVLDAKYRSSRTAVLEGLRDVHVYRDSLRWEGMSPAGAFVIVPALHADAKVFSEQTYLERHQFGALVTDSPELVDAVLSAAGLRSETRGLFSWPAAPAAGNPG